MIEQQPNPVYEDGPKPKRGMGRNIVTDPRAPEYYSERAIYWFSILLFLPFGAIMMAINLWKISKKAAWQVVILSFVYLVLEAIILSRFPDDSGFSIVFNFIGVFFIGELYWKPYIGTDTKYRAKPIWKPLIIAVLLLVVLVLGLISGQ